MSLLVVIVWPKIRRVRSGEKVVMSRLLDAANGVSRTAAAGEPESKFTVPVTEQIRNRITVNRDDPIPKEVETGILAMEELLRGVTNEWYVLFWCGTHSFFQRHSGISSHILIYFILHFTVAKVDLFPSETGSKCVLMLPIFTINWINSTLRGPKMIKRITMQRLR